MTRQEAIDLTTFRNYCNCGGYAWQLNGRDREHPHMEWCAQYEEFEEWMAALRGEG